MLGHAIRAGQRVVGPGGTLVGLLIITVHGLLGFFVIFFKSSNGIPQWGISLSGVSGCQGDQTVTRVFARVL